MPNALAPTPDLIPAPNALRLYEALCDLRDAPPGAWRDCALRLRAAAGEVPSVFRQKYLDRAVCAEARMHDLLATDYVVVPSVAPSWMIAAQEDGELQEVA